MKRGSNGRFQINVVDGTEETEEWFGITHVPIITPNDVPAGQDDDGDLAMELEKDTQPADVCETELILLEQAQRELEEKAQELAKQYQEVMKRQGLLKNVSQPTSSTPVEISPSVKSGTEQIIQHVVTDTSASSSVPQPENGVSLLKKGYFLLP